ncbi:MAG: hypothetical protein Fur0018_07010 [Anaerolineales bacterium]
MKAFSQPALTEILRRLGLQPGDVVLCHAALHFLGRPEGGVGMYYAALSALLDLPNAPGEQGRGTLAVPAFNFAFARREKYDPQSAPSVGMGALSEYVRQMPWARRTPHPMQSLAVVGRHADDLAGRDTPSAFDSGSAFERLLELDGKLLLLGADIQAASMVHYSEQRAAVPYRYWKDFPGQVKTPQGWQERTYRMFVRDMKLDPHLDLHPLQRKLEAQGAWQSQPVNYGWISVCRLRDFVSVTDTLLAADPWHLVSRTGQTPDA